MPNPGQLVDSQVEFDGRLNYCFPHFITEIIDFIESVAGKAYLSPKEVHGQTMTGIQLFHYFQTFFDKFRNGNPDLPRLVDVLRATIQKSMESIVTQCVTVYCKTMMQKLSADQSINEGDIEKNHYDTLAKVRKLFYSLPKMGTADDAKDIMWKWFEDRMAGTMPSCVNFESLVRQWPEPFCYPRHELWMLLFAWLYEGDREEFEFYT